MTVTQTIIAIWLAGWAISATAYILSTVKAAQKTGTPWSPTTHLPSVLTLLFTWLLSWIIYIYAWIKHRSHIS